MSKEVKPYEALLLKDNPRLQIILPHGAILCGKEPVEVYLAFDYEALLAERNTLKKDAERYQLLASTLLANCNGAQMTTQEGALYRALNEIERVNSTAEIDAIFDAALQGEQP